MQGMAFFISWWSLTGVRPVLEDVRATLSKYELGAVLSGFTRISTKLRTWENSPTPEMDREMVASVFPRDWVRRIETCRARNPDSLVFHRITLLFLLKEALQHCSPQALPVNGSADLFAISECFLRANDLVLGYTPSESDSLDQLMAGLLPFYELIPQEAFPEDLIRNIFMFDIVLPTLRTDKRYVDFPALFARHVKIPYRQFAILAFAVGAKPMLAEQDGALMNDDFFLRDSYFSQTSVPPEVATRFLEQIAATQREMREALQSSALATDMTPLQRRPLLRLDDGRLVVLDSSYLMDKAGTGVFWVLREFLAEEEARKAFEFLGMLYEHYAHWFWRAAYQGSGAYMPCVCFPNGDEAFDAVPLEEGVLVAIEYKSGMLAANAKHSFTAEKVTTALDRKFVTSERGERKATRQLHESIKRFLKGEPVGRNLLTREQIHTIHPIIIAADPALTGPLVGRYLDEKLERTLLRKERKQVAIAPLQLATFTDIERLVPYTNRMSFTSILEAANAKSKRSLPSGNLRQRAGDAIVGVTPGTDPIKARWDDFGEEVSQLFPHPS